MNLLLYLITCLIWGSTWYGIKLQTGIVPPIWSATYRFGLAALILFFICIILKRSLRFNLRQHSAMALQGFTLFSISYFLFYTSEEYLVSGVVALIAATAAIMNIFNGRIFLGNQCGIRTIFGSLLGLAGLVLVLWTEVVEIINPQDTESHALLGVLLAIIGTYTASLGNIISAHNQKQQLPVLESNFFSMAYATIFLILLALILHQPIAFNFTASYILSLLYLAILGSVIAFQAYLLLLGRIGPERSAYVFVITPIIALLISTYFEGFHWTADKIIGIGLVIVGNILILTRNKKNA